MVPRNQDRNWDIELGTQRPMTSGDLGLSNFFKKVKEIETRYDKLNTLLIKLQDAQERSRAVTKAADIKAIKQQLEKDVDEVGKIARLTKSKIEELDKEDLSNRQKPGCGKGSGVDKSRTATTVAFRKKFKDRISEFQTLREKIHQEHREVVERRVFTVTGARADKETIDHLIETGDSEKIFQNAIQEQGRGQVMATLAEIKERDDAVPDLERKLLELQQVFLDVAVHMAVLVDSQGNLLENIESKLSFFSSSFLDQQVFPGDSVFDLSKMTDQTIKLGGGLRQDGDFISAIKAGKLRVSGLNKYWVESSQKRYVPVIGDNVLGIVVDARSDSFFVDIKSHTLALLPVLAFEGGTRRNIPKFEVGTLLYLRVVKANPDMIPELSCMDVNGKTGEYGPLKDGFMFESSTELSRMLLSSPTCPILETLGKNVAFEIAVGLNGRVWVNAASPWVVILVANTIMVTESSSPLEQKSKPESLLHDQILLQDSYVFRTHASLAPVI